MTDLHARRVARFNGIPYAEFAMLEEEERIEMEAFFLVETMKTTERRALLDAAKAEEQARIQATLRARVRGQHG